MVPGEADNLPFAEFLKNGELRTNVLLNGRLIDHLNRHVRDQNETAARLRLPVPAGALRAGENVLRLEQVGKKNEPGYLDDLGILGTALEFAPPAPGGPTP